MTTGMCLFIRLCASCLLILFLMGGQCDGQKERYVIDTLVVMDAPAFNSWVTREPAGLPSLQRQNQAKEKIKQYISLVIRQANLRLETLTDDDIDWTVELSVTDFSIGVDLLVGRVDPFKSIPYQTALDTFEIWVAAQGYNNQFDYAILLTGYNLQGDASLPYEIKAIANIGTLCKTDGTSVSVIEDRGGFQSVHFVAHEMGHSLGSKHDGEIPNTECPDEDRYLMAINDSKVTTSNLLNPWHFSICSKKTIWNHLTTEILTNHPSCLTTAKPAAQEFKDTENVLPGQVYDIKAQCQHLYGPESTVCVSEKFKLSDVCTSMFCVDPSDGSGVRCLENRAAEGSSCGTGKICQRGKCIQSNLAPPTQFTDCYFGDATVRIEGQYTCSQYVSNSPRACYQPDIRSACCQSCDREKSQSQVCPFGDKQPQCYTDLCKLIDVDGTRFEDLCCGTCGYDVIKNCDDVPRIDGMTCDERINRNGVQGCYNTSVAYHCCKTCADIRKSVVGCEYGDRTVDNTCAGLVFDEKTCQQYGKQCCHTCSNLDLNTAWSLRGSILIVPISILAWMVDVV